MAGYRQFHTKFWKDGWVIELSPTERYLFTYLFTNEQSSISGIFELPLKIIENETGLDKNFITTTLKKFQDQKKIFYQDGIVWVVKMRQHHKNMSPKTNARVNADVASIPDCAVKTAYQYYQKTGIYSIDTVSIGYGYPSLKDKDKDKDEDESETEQSEPISELSDKFTEITKITPYELDKWVEASQQLTANHITPEELDVAIKKMDADGITYSGLWSVVKTAIWVHSQRANNRPVSGNAQSKTPIKSLQDAGYTRAQAPEGFGK